MRRMWPPMWLQNSRFVILFPIILKTPEGLPRAFSFFKLFSSSLRFTFYAPRFTTLIVHTAAYAAHSRISPSLFFWFISNGNLRRKKNCCGRCCVLHATACDFYRINNSYCDHISLKNTRERIIPSVSVHLFYFLNNNRAIALSGVDRNFAKRRFECADDNIIPCMDLASDITKFFIFQFLRNTNERDTAAGDNSLFDRSLGCIHCILDLELKIFHFRFSRGANLNDRNTAGKFRNACFEFFRIKF